MLLVQISYLKELLAKRSDMKESIHIFGKISICLQYQLGSKFKYTFRIRCKYIALRGNEEIGDEVNEANRVVRAWIGTQ